MSYNPELPQEKLNAMSNVELNTYYRGQELNALRDKFAMAALPGVMAHEEHVRPVRVAAICYELADAMMEERVK